ncbi:MAG: GNAT family N-acetyltransferase, partial [Yersiniaceae bacterium]|nr:GNAT family N-acetyltransferase [Yersiniaceae bacterium]
FEVEGTSPQFAMRDGVLVDAHHMGRLKERVHQVPC